MLVALSVRKRIALHSCYTLAERCPSKFAPSFQFFHLLPCHFLEIYIVNIASPLISVLPWVVLLLLPRDRWTGVIRISLIFDCSNSLVANFPGGLRIGTHSERCQSKQEPSA